MTGVRETTGSSLFGHEFRYFGHTFRLLESARDTDDGLLRFDYTAPPRANIPEHTHHEQEESFEVVSGTLGIRVGGQEVILTPGQSAVGPRRVPHAWWNPSREERVRFLVGIRPGLEVEIMLETVLGLMREGKTIGHIPRNPLQIAVLAQEIKGWVVLTPLTQVLFTPVATLSFVGRLLGYRASYPAYSGPEAARTIRIEQSVEIERPPDEVFAFVADPRNDARWAPACEEVQKTSEGAPGVGMTYRQVGRFLGRRFEVPIEITAYEPNRKMSIKPVAGPVRLTHLRSVEGTTDGTRLTITVEGQTSDFFRVADPAFARLTARLFKASLANLKGLLEAAPAETEPAEPAGTPLETARLLLFVSALWQLNSAIGARVAIREDLPGEFAGMTRWHDPSADFFRGGGTALSPGLPMMAAQAVFTVLSTRGGRAGKVGAAGLAVLGAGGTVGVLGEPITYRVLYPRTFDPSKAPIVSGAIVLSALMAIFGTSRLRALRSGDA